MRKKARTGFLVLVALAVLFLAFVARRVLREELMVDECLSGKHGSFDYSTMSCDLNENHVYVPYQVRHPRDGSSALIAFVALLLSLSGYVWLRNDHGKR